MSKHPNITPEAAALVEEAKTAWGRQDPKRLWNAIDALAALSTQAVPVREPLTSEQIRHELAAHAPNFRPEFSAFYRGVRFAERHFGIGCDTKPETLSFCGGGKPVIQYQEPGPLQWDDGKTGEA